MGENTFADLLRSIRAKSGLSQYELARRSGLSKQSLSQYEAGLREPTWKAVQLLALALGVELAAFRDESLALPTAVAQVKRGRPRKDGQAAARRVSPRIGPGSRPAPRRA